MSDKYKDLQPNEFEKLPSQIRNIVNKYTEKLPSYNSEMEKLGTVIVKDKRVRDLQNDFFVTQNDLIDLCNGINSYNGNPFVSDEKLTQEQLFEVYSNRLMKEIKAELELLVAVKRKVANI